MFRTIDHFGCKRTGELGRGCLSVTSHHGDYPMTRIALQPETDKLGQFDRAIETRVRVLRNSTDFFRVSEFSFKLQRSRETTDCFKFRFKMGYNSNTDRCYAKEYPVWFSNKLSRSNFIIYVQIFFFTSVDGESTV